MKSKFVVPAGRLACVGGGRAGSAPPARPSSLDRSSRGSCGSGGFPARGLVLRGINPPRTRSRVPQSPAPNAPLLAHGSIRCPSGHCRQSVAGRLLCSGLNGRMLRSSGSKWRLLSVRSPCSCVCAVPAISTSDKPEWRPLARAPQSGRQRSSRRLECVPTNNPNRWRGARRPHREVFHCRL